MTATTTPRGNRVSIRLAAVTLAVAATAALGGVAAAPASAAAYGPSLECGNNPSLQAPVQARPPQFNAFFYSVNGGSWQQQHIMTINAVQYRNSAAGFTSVGIGGGAYNLFLGEYGTVVAWAYTWKSFDGATFTPVGWTYLGDC